MRGTLSRAARGARSEASGDGRGAAEGAEGDVERGVGLVRIERGVEGAVAEVLARAPRGR